MAQKTQGSASNLTDEHVRIIVKLNNSATSLLEVGSYKGAMATFHDALAIVKSPSADPVISSRGLNRAEKRIAATPSLADNGVDVPCNHRKKFVIWSHRDDSEKAFQFITNHRHINVFLKIDLQDRSLTRAFVRSVVLYNFGLAHKYTSSGKSDDRSRIINLCLQIFQFAVSTFPSSAASSSSLSSHTLYRMLIFRTLMMLTCRLNLSECERYRKIVDVIEFEIIAKRVSKEYRKCIHFASVA